MLGLSPRVVLVLGDRIERDRRVVQHLRNTVPLIVLGPTQRE